MRIHLPMNRLLPDSLSLHRVLLSEERGFIVQMRRMWRATSWIVRGRVCSVVEGWAHRLSFFLLPSFDYPGASHITWRLRGRLEPIDLVVHVFSFRVRCVVQNFFLFHLCLPLFLLSDVSQNLQPHSLHWLLRGGEAVRRDGPKIHLIFIVLYCSLLLSKFLC